ncbi:MAG: hypothetical protein AAGJ18_20030, partial [Bacteroidota bacterium]
MKSLKPLIIVAAIVVIGFLLMNARQPTPSVSLKNGCLEPDREKFPLDWSKVEETMETENAKGLHSFVSKSIQKK